MATKISALAVQIEMIGVANVRAALRELGVEGERSSRGLRLVGSGAGNASSKYAELTRSVAAFSHQVAGSGRVSTESLRTLLGSVGSLASAFGPYGALVTAVGLGGAAIYNLFKRTREEIEKTQTAFQVSLGQMVNAGDAAGLMKQLRDLERGTPANNFQDALKPKLTQIETLKKFHSSLGEGKVWLGLQAKKQYDELMADPRVKELFALRAAILDPRNAPLRDHARSAITIQGTKPEKPDTRILGEMKLYDPGAPKQMDLVKGLPHDDQLRQESIEKMRARVQPMLQAGEEIASAIRGGLTSTIGEAVYAGFSAAFSGKGLGGVFKSFGKTVLAGIGGIFGQLGQIWIAYGIKMFTLGKFLWNPATAGWAALGIGAALLAMSAALGAAGNGGGGGTAGSGGGTFAPHPAEMTNIKLTATSVADAARIQPLQPIVFNVIGINDPAAFRAIKEGLDKHARRG